MINDWFETFADNYEKSPWKISFYTGISYMFITVLVYLTHINRDNIFPKDLDILNIFPYALTKFFIVSVVIFVLIGVMLEKRNVEFDIVAFVLSSQIQLLIMYNVLKTASKIVKKIMKKFLLLVDDKYIFILDAFLLFILQGYFALHYNDSKNIQIILGSVNVMNIVIGFYQIAVKKLKVDTSLLSEYLIYLYIIISLIISK